MQTVTSLEAAVNPDTIPKGSKLYLSGNILTPVSFLEQLLNDPSIEDITLMGALLTGPDDLMSRLFSEETCKRIKHIVAFAGKYASIAVNKGWASFLPLNLSDLPGYIEKEYKPTVVVIQTSMPINGEYSYGLATDVSAAIKAVEKNNGKLIVISNPNVPFVYGAAVHEGHIDTLIQRETELPQLRFENENKDAAKIGEMIVAKYIRPGVTLQLGIGSIPTKVADLILEKRIGNLNCFTELMCSSLYRLVEEGLITNETLNYSFLGDSKKPWAEKHRPSIMAFLIGESQEDYNKCQENEKLLARDVSITNNPIYIKMQPEMVSVNGGAMIDIYGNVCVTHGINEKGSAVFLKGLGGNSDFCLNAKYGIIAMTSRTKGQSRIVLNLPQGVIPTISTNDQRIYVTEQGIVDLAGLTYDEIPVAIAMLAHPDDRPKLFESMLNDSFLNKDYVQKVMLGRIIPKGFTPYEQICGNN